MEDLLFCNTLSSHNMLCETLPPLQRIYYFTLERWVTYREVIRDSVRVRPKHGKRSGGDCRVSKQ
ncbi:hypothetical protein YC2023_007053 [Brassica napus]